MILLRNILSFFHLGRFRTISVLILLAGCINPIDIQPSDFENYLVVQGFIDDDYGPHNIRISRVARFAGTRDGGSIRREEDAQVRIVDQDGQITTLERLPVIEKRMASGCGLEFVEVITDFQTPDTFRGEVGSTYVLEIITRDDQVYRSTEETMISTPAVDSVTLRFKEIPSLNQSSPGSGIEVFAAWQDPPETDDFYMWRIVGTYKIYTPDRSEGEFCCPYDPVDGGAEECWIVERNMEGNERAFSDFRINGQAAAAPVGFIEDDGVRFSDDLFNPGNRIYHVEVWQYRISEEAFEFNERIELLEGINGEIFDPPPVNIRGNIFNAGDSDETVIGHFGAFSKQTSGKFLSRSQLPFLQFNPRPCGDCRVRRGAQTEIPEPYRDLN